MGRGGGFRVPTRMLGPNKISATNSAEKLFFLLSSLGKEKTGLSVFYVS